MVHGITGWSGGGRRPLSYELMPGQYRSSRVSIFPSKTIINNNIGGCCGGNYSFYDSCCGGNDGGIPSWCRKLLGWGMGMSFASNLMNMIFGGGSRGTEGAGGAETQKPVDLQALKSDAKVYAKQYKVEIDVLSDGSLLCNKKKYSSLEELSEDLKSENPTAATTSKKAEVAPPATSTTRAVSGGDQPADGVDSKEEFQKLFGDDFVTKNYNPQKGLTINNTECKTVDEAFKQLSQGNAAVKPNDTSNLNDILKNIVGVYDDGKDKNGNDIKDFTNLTVSLPQNTTYKDGENVKIGNNTYKISVIDGYLYLEDTSPTGGSSKNKQIYLVEKNAQGKYELHQRDKIKHNDGYGAYAHKNS